jgi:hypothetical protein
MDTLETYLRYNQTTQDAVKLSQLLHQESLERPVTGSFRQEDHNNFAYMMTAYRVIAAYSSGAPDAESHVEAQPIDVPDSFKTSFDGVYQKVSENVNVYVAAILNRVGSIIGTTACLIGLSSSIRARRVPSSCTPVRNQVQMKSSRVHSLHSGSGET